MVRPSTRRPQVLLPLVVVLVFLLRRRNKLAAWLGQYLHRWRAHRRRKRRIADANGDPFERLDGSVVKFEERYAILQRITDSTFGSVFECRRRAGAEGSNVVKIVSKRNHPLLRGEIETDVFRCYMSKLLMLDHVNVVRYLEFFANSTSYYFVMERCPGRTLLEHLLSAPVWQEASVQPLMRQLLTALSYIHGQGVVHRDVKLENVMVVLLPAALIRSRFWRGTSTPCCPRLKLLDFGLGCEASDARGSFGTLGYMAPETFSSSRYGASVDIFSAGVVMHICLTGRPAFPPPLNARFPQGHVQALQKGPDFRRAPLPAVMASGLELLQWMLLPAAVNRCTAQEALQHRWTSQERPKHGCVLWSSSSSELQFLRVMGVWNGASSASGSVAGRPSLVTVDEGCDEEEAALKEDLCSGLVRLIRHMSVPVSIADPATSDCSIIAVSVGFEALTGYKEDAIIGMNCRILNQPRRQELSEETISLVQDAARGKSTFLGVLPNVRKDGSYFDNLLHLSAISVKGQPLVVGIQCDVSERETADLSDHEIVSAARKVHAAIRHWLRSEAKVSGIKRMHKSHTL